MFLRAVFQNIWAAVYPRLVNFRGIKKYFHKKGSAQKILVINDRETWDMVEIEPQVPASFLFIKNPDLFVQVFQGIINDIFLFSCLSRSVSQELSETILTMVANCSNVMNKARQPPPGVMPKGRPPSASSVDAISPVQVNEHYIWYISIWSQI